MAIKDLKGKISKTDQLITDGYVVLGYTFKDKGGIGLYVHKATKFSYVIRAGADYWISIDEGPHNIFSISTSVFNLSQESRSELTTSKIPGKERAPVLRRMYSKEHVGFMNNPSDLFIFAHADTLDELEHLLVKGNGMKSALRTIEDYVTLSGQDRETVAAELKKTKEF